MLPDSSARSARSVRRRGSRGAARDPGGKLPILLAVRLGDHLLPADGENPDEAPQSSRRTGEQRRGRSWIAESGASASPAAMAAHTVSPPGLTSAVHAPRRWRPSRCPALPSAVTAPMAAPSPFAPNASRVLMNQHPARMLADPRHVLHSGGNHGSRLEATPARAAAVATALCFAVAGPAGAQRFPVDVTRSRTGYGSSCFPTNRCRPSVWRSPFTPARRTTPGIDRHRPSLRAYDVHRLGSLRSEAVRPASSSAAAATRMPSRPRISHSTSRSSTPIFAQGDRHGGRSDAGAQDRQ